MFSSIALLSWYANYNGQNRGITVKKLVFKTPLMTKVQFRCKVSKYPRCCSIIHSLEANKQLIDVSFQKQSNEIINVFVVQILVSTQSSG